MSDAPSPGEFQRPLFFLHIPKTAGRSATAMIGQRFAAGRSKDKEPENFTGDPSDYDFVAAHLDFAFVSRFRTRPIVLTFLRNPLERAMSRWRFALDDIFAPGAAARLPRDHALAHEFNRMVRTMPLHELLEREPDVARPFLGNVQTAYLMGSDRADPVLAPATMFEVVSTPTTMAELGQAKRNLERCDVIGLTEEFDPSMAWLARRMGWEGAGPSKTLNVSKVRRGDVEPTPRALEILTEWNRLDLALYAHAGRLVAQRRERCARGAGAPLPSAEGYTFDQPIHGVGWHERERDAGGWFCWTGPEDASLLYLRPPGRAVDHRLTIQVAHTIHPDAVDHMRVAVNGEAVPIRCGLEASHRVLEARVPGSSIAASRDRLCLSFRPGARQRACDLDSASKDHRLLGVALRSINLTAV